MKGFLALLSINASGKVVSLVVFALMARVLDKEHLAYIGLIPALSAFLLAALGLGVGTALERDVPRLRASDPGRADAVMRSGLLVAASSVLWMALLFLLFTDAFTRMFLSDYAFQAAHIRWIMFPIAGYMLLEITGWMLIIRGEAKQFGILQVYGDICAKSAALACYAWRPSELSIFCGLAFGQAAFLIAGLWLQRKWLFRLPIASPAALVRLSGVFYLEAIFQSLRDRGDSLLVSSVLGPVAMASYYVAKTVAAQLSVVYNAVTSITIPEFSSHFGRGAKELSLVFRRVWTIAPPFFVWAASSVAAVAPFLIVLIAGPAFRDTWQTAVLLCYVTALMSIYAIASRILLLMGSSIERFRVVLIHAVLLAGLVLLVGDRFGAEGVAAAWVTASIGTILVVRLRARRIGFCWPATTALRRSVILCVPVPLLMLYGVGYGQHPDWIYLMAAGGLSVSSLVGLLVWQDAFEEKQMLAALPRLIVPMYRVIRKISAYRLRPSQG